MHNVKRFFKFIKKKSCLCQIRITNKTTSKTVNMMGSILTVVQKIIFKSKSKPHYFITFLVRLHFK